MKNTFLFGVALLFGAVASAQTDTTAKTKAPLDSTFVTGSFIDSSVGKAYVTKPERLNGLTTETLTTAHIFPAIGSYKGSGTSTNDVTINLDETNKGMVWVDGLPQGRFKAIMKKAPSTYKIPAQKSDSGKDIAEGTLYVDTETNELTIVLGSSFNDADPTAFKTASVKNKNIWQYTGTKAVTEAAAGAPAPLQQ